MLMWDGSLVQLHAVNLLLCVFFGAITSSKLFVGFIIIVVWRVQASRPHNSYIHIIYDPHHYLYTSSSSLSFNVDYCNAGLWVITAKEQYIGETSSERGMRRLRKYVEFPSSLSLHFKLLIVIQRRLLQCGAMSNTC